MRVLAVTPWFPTEKDPGAGIFNLRDVEMLSMRHDVRVLHLVPPGAPLDGAVPGNRLGISVTRAHFALGRPETYLGAVGAIRRHVQGIDLVHSMAFPALFPTKWAGVQVPWVHTEHWSALVTTAPTRRAAIASKVLKRAFRWPDAVVAVGADLAQAIRPYREAPPAVIGNKVMTAPAGQLPAEIPTLGATCLRLIGVGALIERKGVREAIDAIAKLAERGISASLQWVGSGGLQEELVAHAQRLGVAERVTFSGHLAPNELSGALLGAHMFVLPTDGETFGVSIAEALGHGLPVVTSGVGGHLAFLPPLASRVIEERTGAALADAIIDLAQDPNRLASKDIRAGVARQYSEELRSEAYGTVYGGVAVAR